MIKLLYILTKKKISDELKGGGGGGAEASAPGYQRAYSFCCACTNKIEERLKNTSVIEQSDYRKGGTRLELRLDQQQGYRLSITEKKVLPLQ